MGAQITAIVFSSNEIRAYEIEQEYLSAVQDPEPLWSIDEHTSQAASTSLSSIDEVFFPVGPLNNIAYFV